MAGEHFLLQTTIPNHVVEELVRQPFFPVKGFEATFDGTRQNEN